MAASKSSACASIRRAKDPHSVPWPRCLHLSSVAQPSAVTRWRDFLRFAPRRRQVSAGSSIPAPRRRWMTITGFPGPGPAGAHVAARPAAQQDAQTGLELADELTFSRDITLAYAARQLAAWNKIHTLFDPRPCIYWNTRRGILPCPRRRILPDPLTQFRERNDAKDLSRLLSLRRGAI